MGTETSQILYFWLRCSLLCYKNIPIAADLDIKHWQLIIDIFLASVSSSFSTRTVDIIIRLSVVRYETSPSFITINMPSIVMKI